MSLRLCASIWVVTEGGIWFVQSLNSRVERNKKVYGIRRNTSQGGNLKKKKKEEEKKIQDVVPVQERQKSVLAILLRGCVPAWGGGQKITQE